MYTKYYLLGSIALFFLSGCTGLPLDKHDYPDPDNRTTYDKEIKDHVIAIGKDGELRDPLTGQERLSSQDYLNNIVKQIKDYAEKKTDGEPELLIYIHGGLNTEGSALKRALEKYRLIKDSGKYPVFINWRSGPITTYKDHLWQIRQGEKEESTLKKVFTWPVYLFTDIGNSIVNTPKAWVVSGGHWFDSTFNFKKENVRDDIAALKGTDIHFNGDDKDVSNWFRHIQWILTSPSKVVTTPFTYTMAKPAWDVMLRRTSTLFYTPNDLEPKDLPEKTNKTVMHSPVKFKSGNGALYRFLSALEKDPEASKVKITLVGHSMGAIVVNNIVNLGLDLTYDNIIHMASADSTENLFNKVVPYIDCSLKTTCNNNKGYTPVNFYSLYLHPDNENREVSAKGFTPSGSLLTWIDGMFTTPKTVLDKRSGRWDNMVRAIELIPPNIKGQMHFTIFGIQGDKKCSKEQVKSLKIEGEDGLNCTAQEHGDFGDLPFWREEVWKGEHLSAQGE